MADDAVDVWLKPYERSSDTEAAMNAYLSWEVDLLERIKQDGTTISSTRVSDYWGVAFRFAPPVICRLHFQV